MSEGLGGEIVPVIRAHEHDLSLQYHLPSSTPVNLALMAFSISTHYIRLLLHIQALLGAA